MIKVINGIAVEVIQGDITNQPGYTAVVNSANAQLMPGGGVAGAIHSVAGHQLALECKPLAPIKPGEAVITKGYNLPNKFVIHCLGPIYGIDKPEEILLRNCYINALKLAEENEIVSIAFPAISTGAFGYPFKEASIIALETIIGMTNELERVKFIRMVLYSNQDYETTKSVLIELTD